MNPQIGQYLNNAIYWEIMRGIAFRPHMLGNPGRAVDVGTKCIVSKQTLPLEKVYLTRVANCLFIGYLISWFDMANKINLSPPPRGFG